VWCDLAFHGWDESEPEFTCPVMAFIGLFLLRSAHCTLREVADRDVDSCIPDHLEIEVRMLFVTHFEMCPIDPFHLQIDRLV
jgi:hypothetical protein